MAKRHRSSPNRHDIGGGRLRKLKKVYLWVRLVRTSGSTEDVTACSLSLIACLQAIAQVNFALEEVIFKEKVKMCSSCRSLELI
jgi:hypothetical protein